jgi:RNA recognition motif-containing protein
MSTKLFVGNLSFNTTENQLQDLFAAHGNVIEVELIMDKFSGRPRGFGFVTMETKEAADAAVQALNGKSVDGRAMTVNEARPREERPRSGGGGGGGGGYRGGGDRGGHRGERREYRG